MIVNKFFLFYFFRCNDNNLLYIIKDTKHLNADLIELSLLETLILCRKGKKMI